MDNILQTLATEAAEFLLNPMVLVGTTVVWLLIATGVAGRLSMLLEDLRHPASRTPRATVPIRRVERPAPRVLATSSAR